VPWETFFTYGESTVYGESASLAKLKDPADRVGCGGPSAPAEITSAEACCAPSCCTA
jgi:hypothetical protein